MQFYICDLIRPEGWRPWNDTTDYFLDSLHYLEFENHGPVYSITGRVKWPGHHRLNDPRQATNFTVSEFIQGDLWLLSTSIEFLVGEEFDEWIRKVDVGYDGRIRYEEFIQRMVAK
ncbi:hypothetical protein IFM89_028626 [Coptis chinensis]|uniref:EF-hand domain-containing protein n=1 Tax=Coptis chinensis TaxID=261450 RepID=A0A835IC21_9MAGN|nr:hypothetical protein IFM89_028626 [Coptis chinensis]